MVTRPETHDDFHRIGSEDPGLDWQAFLARFFPQSRRHDLRALKAYESYRAGTDAARAEADGD